MPPLSDQRPSLLGAVLLAMAVATFFFCFSGAFAELWLPRHPASTATHAPYGDSIEQQTRFAQARQRRETWCMAFSGTLTGILAGFAWRSGSASRFHIAYLSGLTVLILSYCHVSSNRQLAAISASSGVSDYAYAPGEYEILGHVIEESIGTATGLILILAALALDRDSKASVRRHDRFET